VILGCERACSFQYLFRGKSVRPTTWYIRIAVTILRTAPSSNLGAKKVFKERQFCVGRRDCINSKPMSLFSRSSTASYCCTSSECQLQSNPFQKSTNEEIKSSPKNASLNSKKYKKNTHHKYQSCALGKKVTKRIR
jgi:hypothetical protein